MATMPAIGQLHSHSSCHKDRSLSCKRGTGNRTTTQNCIPFMVASSYKYIGGMPSICAHGLAWMLLRRFLPPCEA
eukprot:6482195-Amphidinium_carterae.2